MPSRKEIFGLFIRGGASALPLAVPHIVEAHIAATQQPAPSAIVETDNRTSPRVNSKIAVKRNGVAVPLEQFQGPFDPEDARRYPPTRGDLHPYVRTEKQQAQEIVHGVVATIIVGGFAGLVWLLSKGRERY